MAAPHRPTLETVAALCGYSRSTVSRVVNQSPRVAADVRLVVEEALHRVGYVPNRAARNLATRRTESVALVVCEPVQFGAVDPYISSVIVAASQSLAGTGMQLTLLMASDDDDHARLGDYVRAGHVDGVILMSVHDDDPLPQALARAGVPMVLGGRLPKPIPGATGVDVDNVGGGRTAAAHLLARGHRHLAVIAGPADMTAAVDRLDGFSAGLAEAGQAPPLIVRGSFTRTSGEEAAREILFRAPQTSAIFAANDVMATGALGAMRAAGRRVPDDVALIGFDDVDLGLYTDPPLTTIHQPIARQACTMVEMLLRRVDGLPVEESVTLPTHLVIRGTA